MSNQKYKMAQTDMNEEAYGYFIVGLRIAIKDAGYKYEKDFADGIMNPVTLSNNLRGKQQMSDANIRKCLERLNSDVSEVVLKGKQAENSVSTLPHYETTRAAAGDYSNPNDIMPAVASWVAEFQKSKDRLGFWRMAFDMLPTAALIIKDRIVVYQNQKSLALGRVIGGALCDNCAGKDMCKDKENCPVNTAIKSGISSSGYRNFSGKIYKMEIDPFRWNDIEYFVVTATERMDDIYQNVIA